MDKIEQLEKYIKYLKSLAPINKDVLDQLIEEKEKELAGLTQVYRALEKSDK